MTWLAVVQAVASHHPGEASTMSDLSNLQTLKTNLITALNDAIASPKPTYSIDGQSISWGEYYRMLSEQIKVVNELINMEDPYWHTSQVM